MRRVRLALFLLVALLAVGALVVRHTLVASIAQTDGTHALAGLTAAVHVDRDALGIPTIRGVNRRDVARATGFVHAQERFFEMDLARRFAAGELSELVGAAALENDKKYRLHRMRALAREVLARALPAQRALLQAYTDGVNDGLEALGARPFEYLLLRAQPAAWRTEDSILVVGAMFGNDLELSRRELEIQAMYDATPAPLVDFLRPLGDEWDAPLTGGPMTPPPLPGPDVFDARKAGGRMRQSGPAALPPSADDRLLPPAYSLGAGSNAWAIAASHTIDGRALVANDPHLPVQVPNIWYRLALQWRDERGVAHRAVGVSLPGLPFVAIGSNGHVAWGFTVAFDDRSDMVIIETDGNHPGMYRTPDGPKPFEHTIEAIKVKGSPDVRFDITSTIWGPIVRKEPSGRVLAQQWQAHHPDGVNLAFADMENCATVEQALDIANRSAMPSYNLIVADERGSIGWTVTGRLPRRVGFDGRVPVSWADGARRWDGWLDAAEYPRLVNPPSGRIWNGNSRQVDRPELDRLGLEGYVMGPRARQVRDALLSRDRSNAFDSLRIQLDDRALFLDRWRAFLLEALGSDDVGDPQRAEFRRLLRDTWDGHASAASVAYRLVNRFRFELARLVIRPLAPAAEAQAFRPGVLIEWWESALWRLVHDRPAHLLAPQWRDWNHVILAAVDGTIVQATADGRPLSSATWGSTTSPIAHPLSRAVPWLARWLDMPLVALPGDTNMPRVRMPAPTGQVSATMRMVVSPGHEETGILHMPGGQSGNPLSPHYRDMHQSWVDGRPTSFLPGRTVQTLLLTPR